MAVNKYLIREQNESVVLKTIIDREPISRAEVAAITHLNKASVSSIAKTLIENHLVHETGMGDTSSAGGRKPIMLQFNGHCALGIALDIGSDYIAAVLSYLNGEIVCSVIHKKLSIHKENIFSLTDEIIHDFERKAPQTPHGIVGITAAIHGTVCENRIRFTPYYDLALIDLANELQTRYSYPVMLENEANLTALGEYSFSCPSDNIISISIHSGIGAGLVLNGNLLTGQHGQAGEIGHSILMPDGKICPCGNHGCLEQYASNKAMYERFAAEKQLATVNSDILSAAYQGEDSLAVELLHENAKLLAVGINNITTFFDPQIIIINSSVYRKNPKLIEQLSQHIKSSFTDKVTVRNSLLGEQAPLYGGIASIAMDFLHIPNLKFKGYPDVF
ncbi:ROK family protein [Scatolibacter rhodanostii]|uniref:ROK family protein n=1 Tax=Scatolibacter rhodanostii TaxID=2014781 RepID=UPI000C06E7BE|nr:ROK family protein [Scatolibacter rhodanostii]